MPFQTNAVESCGPLYQPKPSTPIYGDQTPVNIFLPPKPQSSDWYRILCNEPLVDIIESQGHFLKTTPSTPVIRKCGDHNLGSILALKLDSLLRITQTYRVRHYGNDVASEWPIGHTPPKYREEYMERRQMEKEWFENYVTPDTSEGEEEQRRKAEFIRVPQNRHLASPPCSLPPKDKKRSRWQMSDSDFGDNGTAVQSTKRTRLDEYGLQRTGGRIHSRRIAVMQSISSDKLRSSASNSLHHLR